MNRRQLELIVTLPWLAAAVKLGLLGSAAICFSIGCLARTSLGLHDLASRTPPSPAAKDGPR